jgi:hypothetical protein
MSISDEVERFLGTGEWDPRFSAWEGSAVERRRRAYAAFREVLRRVVAYRAKRAPLPPRPAPADAPAQVRTRVDTMLRGLFAPSEAEILLLEMPARVVVVTPAVFASRIDEVSPRTAWDLANLLLDDLGAPPLTDDTPELDGLCAAGHAWVLPRAFAAPEGFTDVVVHEVAHLLHTLRGEDVGLPTVGPLLRVPPLRRETFAYACEVWARVTADAATPPERIERLRVFRATAAPEDARVQRPTLDALLAAAGDDPGGGWGVIGGWASRRSGRSGST